MATSRFIVQIGKDGKGLQIFDSRSQKHIGKVYDNSKDVQNVCDWLNDFHAQGWIRLTYDG